MTFTYNGRAFDLLDHDYNATITNERAVEIPIARAFVAEQEGQGLELGNVLGHYGCVAPRRVVDRYEEADSGEHLDVFAIDGQYDWIVSVSTIEHIRINEGEQYNPWGAVAALAYMRGLLREGGHMLVTVGLGQNHVFDEFVTNYDAFGADDQILVRTRGATPAENEWIATKEYPEVLPPYGPTHGANAVWIGEW